MALLTVLQTVSCDEFLPRTHAHSHTRFSAARTSHARVRFAQNSIAHAPARFTIFFCVLNFFLNAFCQFTPSRDFDGKVQHQNCIIFKNQKKIAILGHLLPVLPQKFCKSVLKCDRTSHARKRAARTHIAHTFQNAFRTHIAHVRVCAHVCVCEFLFATHRLKICLVNRKRK